MMRFSCTYAWAFVTGVAGWPGTSSWKCAGAFDFRSTPSNSDLAGSCGLIAESGSGATGPHTTPGQSCGNSGQRQGPASIQPPFLNPRLKASSSWPRRSRHRHTCLRCLGRSTFRVQSGDSSPEDVQLASNRPQHSPVLSRRCWPLASIATSACVPKQHAPDLANAGLTAGFRAHGGHTGFNSGDSRKECIFLGVTGFQLK